MLHAHLPFWLTVARAWQAEFLDKMLSAGTGYNDSDGLLPAIRALELPTSRANAHAAAVLAADPPDINGVPRSRARAKAVAKQRWGQKTHPQRLLESRDRREAAQQAMQELRAEERAAREAEPEAPLLAHPPRTPPASPTPRRLRLAYVIAAQGIITGSAL